MQTRSTDYWFRIFFALGWILGCNDSESSTTEDLWENTPILCRDNLDNDEDGKVDCADPDCDDLYVCQEGDSDLDTGLEPGDEDTDTMWTKIYSASMEIGDDDGDPALAPAHIVYVRTFEIMRTEVTVAQYQACVADGACDDLSDAAYCASGRSPCLPSLSDTRERGRKVLLLGRRHVETRSEGDPWTAKPVGTG